MKPEKIFTKRGTMIVLNVYLDNFYAFKDFQMNLTYPKKIVDSYIQDEHLKDHPNFRYKWEPMHQVKPRLGICL